MGATRVFTNLNIKTKLLATFAVMVILIVVGSIIGAGGIARSRPPETALWSNERSISG